MRPVSLGGDEDRRSLRLCRRAKFDGAAQAVRASWFQADGFFDARDLVQVKYEMLRQVSIDGVKKVEPPLSLVFPVPPSIRPKPLRPRRARCPTCTARCCLHAAR